MRNTETGRTPGRLLGLMLALLCLGAVLLLARPAGAAAQTGWVVKGNQVRYRTASGYVKGKVTRIDGAYYAFNKKGYRRTGWVTYKNKRYYFSKETGQASIGVTQIGQSLYCFDEKGVMQTGFFLYGGSLYYGKASGKLVCGKYFTVSKQKYYAYPDGHLARNGWYMAEYYDSRGRKAQETYAYDDALQGKLTASLLAANGANKCKKLMIVAHPDDETLWGGAHLSEGGYFVLCITNGDYDVRAREFVRILRTSGNRGLILNYPDYNDVSTRTKSQWVMQKAMIAKDVATILAYKDWKLIATHNPEGEYGHKHHQLVSSIVSQCYFSSTIHTARLYYFGKYYKASALTKAKSKLKKVSSSKLKKKNAYLALYSNEEATIRAHSHMNPYETWVPAEEWWK